MRRLRALLTDTGVPEVDVERLQVCRDLRASAMRLYGGMHVSIMIASKAELRIAGDCCV